MTSGQERFQPEDVVTFSDCREVVSVVLGQREVFFATGNGIWRLDRYTGESLDPLSWGRGWERALVLDKARVALWHSLTSTLWLATPKALLYYRWGIERWERMDEVPAGHIRALGQTEDAVIVDLGDFIPRFAVINPFIFKVTERRGDAPDDVKWTSVWEPHPLPNYFIEPASLWFNPDDGLIRDWKFNRFKPAFDMVDDHFNRRYICYPWLGIGVADERHYKLTIIQPGPAGSDVRAIALGDDGEIWVGGDNGGLNDGVNRFDRITGRWENWDSQLAPGMDSHRINAAIWLTGRLYCATDVGVQTFDPETRRWRAYDRFDGLVGEQMRTMAEAKGQLFVGGDQGVNRMRLPEGPIFPAGDERVDKLRTAQIIADGDTIWAAGLEGLFRWDAAAGWTALAADDGTVGLEAARSLAVTPDRLWVGGKRGIRELDRRSGRWRGWLAQQYLGGGLPLCMEANDSLLWVGTDRGLFAIHHRKGAWLNYSTDEGLPALRIQTIKLEADTLWLGTPKGLTRFIWNRPERDVF